MTHWLGRVTVIPKPSVNDPQGLAVLGGLHHMGFSDVRKVRVGRHVDVTLQAESEARANDRLKEMCEQLLANTLIESYSFEVTEELVE